MKKLASVMPHNNLLNGFPASNMMCNEQLVEVNLCSLDISKSHKTSLHLVIIVRTGKQNVEKQVALSNYLNSQQFSRSL